jgi:hypothetical protein
VSYGMPCWTCGRPIPPDRHRLPGIQRVFCGDTCRVSFTPPGYVIKRAGREARLRCANCGETLAFHCLPHLVPCCPGKCVKNGPVEPHSAWLPQTETD